MHNNIDRLDRNLRDLKSTINNGEYGSKPQTPEQRLATEIVVDSAAIAAQAHIPKQQAVNTFDRAFQQTEQTTNDQSRTEQWSGSSVNR